MYTGFFIIILCLVLIIGLMYWKTSIAISDLTRQKATLSQDLNLYKTGLMSLMVIFKDRSEMLHRLKSKVQEHPLKLDDMKRIQKRYTGANSWEHFLNDYEKIEQPWLATLCAEYPLSPNDKKILIMQRLQLSNADMAAVMNVSSEGLKKAKSRLRKKLKTTKS
ncbi:MAG: helix-turn-helix transcriptional regulator [Flavobacteriales bacterium]